MSFRVMETEYHPFETILPSQFQSTVYKQEISSVANNIAVCFAIKLSQNLCCTPINFSPRISNDKLFSGLFYLYTDVLLILLYITNILKQNFVFISSCSELSFSVVFNDNAQVYTCISKVVDENSCCDTVLY